MHAEYNNSLCLKYIWSDIISLLKNCELQVAIHKKNKKLKKPMQMAAPVIKIPKICNFSKLRPTKEKK